MRTVNHPLTLAWISAFWERFPIVSGLERHMMAHNDAPKATQRLRGDANNVDVCSVKVLICLFRTTFSHSYSKDSLTVN